MSSPDAPAHAGEALGRGDPALALAALPGGPPAGFVSRPFWLFWFFENISVAGRWMMEIAGGWLVARLADSAAQVASLISIASIPVLVSMAWAGQVADRYDRRRTVLLTEVLACVLAVVSAIMVHAELATLLAVAVWFVLHGVVDAFNRPAKQALSAELVERHQLSNAVAMLGMSGFLGRLVGPALAAAILTVGPLSLVFFADAVSYLPLVVLLVVLRPRQRLDSPPPPPPEVAPRAAPALGAALRFAWARPRMRATFGAVGLIAVCALPFQNVFLPLFVKDALRGSARDLALVLTGAGFGSLLGYVSLLRGRSSMGPGLAVTAPRWAGMRLVCAPLVVGLAQVGLSYSTSPLGAAVMLAISSFGIATLAGLTLMFIQLTCPQDLQGRLLGLHNILFAVVPPAGIVMGMLTHYVELRVSMRFFGLLFAGVSTAWLLLARIGSADLTRAEGNGVV